MRRKLLFLLVLFLGFAAASCRTEVKGFTFRDGKGADIQLFAGSSKSSSEDGFVSLKDGPASFSLKAPAEIGEGTGLRLKLERGLPGVTVEASGKRAGAGGAFTVSSRLPDCGELPTEFQLSLPQGILTDFSFKSSEKKDLAFKVREIGLGPFEASALLDRSRLKASSWVLPLSFSRTDRKLNAALAYPEGKGSLKILFPKTAVASKALPKIVLKGAGKRFAAEVLLRPVEEPFYFHPGFLGFVPEELEILSLPEDGVEVSVVRDATWERGAASFSPLPMDLGSLLDYPAEAWRNERVEVFRWTLFPNILVFGTPTYQVQNRFFHRLAFFVEKAGYRGKLWPDEEIREKHGWNAHNYSAEGLAAFFEKARKTSFPLHNEEIWLRDYLAAAGVLRKDGEAFAPGKGGILAFSLESLSAHRRLLLTHEAFHGIFYNLPDFRRLAEETWRKLPNEEKDFWYYFFSWMAYDVRDPYLVVNEFQAYLLQQPLRGIDQYYKETILNRITEKYPERKPKYDALIEKNPDMFSRPAKILHDSLFQAVGVRAGNVFSLYPEKK